MKTIALSVGGSMPYQSRLQLIDLLFWRAIQRGADQEVELEQSGALPSEAKGFFSSIYGDAERELEAVRNPGDFYPDLSSRYLELEYRNLRSPKEREYTVFYPSFVQIQYKSSLIDELLSREKLSLSTASLAAAALRFEPYRITAIQTVNPLNVKLIILSASFVIPLLAYATNKAATFPAEHHMATFCSNVTDAYQDELAKTHIDKEHALMLGEALRDCYSSPIFSSSPISLGMPDDEKE